MVAQNPDGSRDLTVSGIYKFFKALEVSKTADGKDALEAFLSDCDEQKLTLGVSEALWSTGHTHYEALLKTGARIESVGSDCPACSGPPRL